MRCDATTPPETKGNCKMTIDRYDVRAVPGVSGSPSPICNRQSAIVNLQSLRLFRVLRDICLLLPLCACASPPSVVPLLRVAERAIGDEQRLLGEDAIRGSHWFEQQRRVLDDAYAADLRGRPERASDPEWVLAGTEVYTAAREALLRHAWELERQSELRRDNLGTASQAIRRAAELIEKQDALFADVPDLRQILLKENP